MFSELLLLSLRIQIHFIFTIEYGYNYPVGDMDLSPQDSPDKRTDATKHIFSLLRGR